MKNVVAVIFGVCLVCLLSTSTTAFPALDDYFLQDVYTGIQEEPLSSYESLPRMRRATCDLLSFSFGGFSANHAVCAAHCLALGNGYRGGRCIDGVCNCRR